MPDDYTSSMGSMESDSVIFEDKLREQETARPYGQGRYKGVHLREQILYGGSLWPFAYATPRNLEQLCSHF